MEIPIQDVKALATKLQADVVIVIAFRDENFGTTSYGSESSSSESSSKDRATCRAFSRVCDQIHDDIAEGIISIPSVPVSG